MSKRVVVYYSGRVTTVEKYSCNVAYRLNAGASIDYTRIKTINISDFAKLKSNAYSPLAQKKFSEDLKHCSKPHPPHPNQAIGRPKHRRRNSGPLIKPAVQADAYAACTKLTMKVNVVHQ